MHSFWKLFESKKVGKLWIFVFWVCSRHDGRELAISGQFLNCFWMLAHVSSLFCSKKKTLWTFLHRFKTYFSISTYPHQKYSPISFLKQYWIAFSRNKECRLIIRTYYGLFFCKGGSIFYIVIFDILQNCVILEQTRLPFENTEGVWVWLAMA